MTGAPEDAVREAHPQRWIICRFCGHRNPTGGDACENCGAEFSEGMPESPTAFEGRLLGTRLGDLATGKALWLDGSLNALAAVARMKAEGADCILVRERGELAGIFTDRDAMVKLAGRQAPGPQLRSVMTAHPEVLRADDTVAMAIHKMAVGQLRHVPLVSGDGSVAVIGARDIFRHLAQRGA